MVDVSTPGLRQTRPLSSLQEPGIRRLLADAAERAASYLAGVDDRPVAPGEASLRGLEEFDETLPDDGTDPADTLARLDRIGSPATTASAGGRYFGFVTGGTLPVALASAWLSAAWDQNAALPIMSPVAARLHDVTSGWLLDILGLPAGCAVAFVPGASLANVTALAAARDHQLARLGWDVESDGLLGAPAITVVVGERAHSTVIKALGLLGLGRDRVRSVPADGQGRLRVDRLPEDVTGPAIVCAQAGEVNTGAFDDFNAVVGWAREREAWVHVDGAFGLWAAVDPTRAELTTGMADADSWATDGHKWLNVTYDSGMAVVRRPADLQRSFASSAGYLPAGDGFEAMHHSPQASQRARQVEVWAVLRTHGRRGIARLVQRNCEQARSIAAELGGVGLEVLNEVVLNQVLLRASSDDATVALIDAVQRDGTCWCGPTTWEGRPAMRVSVSGWATTDEDVASSVRAIASMAAEVGGLRH